MEKKIREENKGNTNFLSKVVMELDFIIGNSIFIHHIVSVHTLKELYFYYKFIFK